MQLQGHKLGFKGQFSATLIGADGKVKEFVDVNKRLRSGEVIRNRLLDNFFTRLISLENPISFLSVRCSANADPINDTSTTLVGQITLNSGNWPSVAGTSTNAVIDGPLLKVQSIFTFTFGTGQITGNISKLAINYEGTSTAVNTTIHAEALVVDNVGDPTTISPGIDEQLILSYTLFMETPVADVVTTVVADFDGVPTNVEVTQRWGLLNNLTAYVRSSMRSSSAVLSPLQLRNGALNAVGAQPSGTLSNGSSPSVTPNVGGVAKELVFPFTTSQGNLAGGASSCIVGGDGIVKAGFNPPIPKTADDTLSITFRQTFGRLP